MKARLPTTQTLPALACLVLTGCGLSDLGDLSFEFNPDCPWEEFLETDEPLAADEGDGQLWGVCKPGECNDAHPLAVGVEVDIGVYVPGFDESEGGELKSSDPAVLRVQQRDHDRCNARLTDYIEHAATLEVVGAGEADLEVHRDGEVISRWHFHAAEIADMRLGVTPDRLTKLITPDGGLELPDGGMLTPSYFKDGGEVITTYNASFQVKLKALDATGRRLVVGAGPTEHDILIDSYLSASPEIMRIDNPHGGANAIYDVTVRRTQDAVLTGTFPDHGVSAQMQVRVLEEEAYEEAYREWESR